MIVKRLNLEVATKNQEAFPLAGKNTMVVLVLCCAQKCVPTAICGGADISKFSWCHLL